MTPPRDLPNDWAWVTAAEICAQIPSGSTPPSEEMFADRGEVPFVKVYNLTKTGALDFSVRPTFISRETHVKKLARSVGLPGDILMNIVGPPLGKVSVLTDVHPEWNYNQAIVAFRVLPSVDSRYLALYLLSEDVADWSRLNSKATAGQYNLSVTSCRELPIPLPPRQQQTRIVERVTRLTSRSRRAKEALDAIPPLLERFRQSVLAAAFRGDLTAEWRAKNPDVEPADKLLQRIRTERRRRWEESEFAKMQAKGKPPGDDRWKDKYEEAEPVDMDGLAELPSTWCWASTAELVIDGPTNGYSPVSGQDATGALTLKLSATTAGRFILNAETTKRIYEPVRDDSGYWLEPNDVVVQRANTIEYVGTAAVYTGPGKTYIYPDLMMRLRASPMVDGRLIWRAFNSNSGRAFLRERATGTAGNMPKINGSTVRALPIPLLPEREQDLMLSAIDRSEAYITAVADCIAMASTRNRDLDRSILAKAFRGELVPQDPSDEPASVLLDRIRAERATAAAAKEKKPTKRR